RSGAPQRFEAGWRSAETRTAPVLVQLGEVRPFSDSGGRHVVHLGDDATKPTAVRDEARQPVATWSRRDDWFSTGSFSVANMARKGRRRRGQSAKRSSSRLRG